MHTISPRLDGTPPRLRITGIDCHVLLAPDYDPAFTSSAQDSLIVAIHTDQGVTGIRRMRRQSLDGQGLHRGARAPTPWGSPSATC